MNKLPDFFIYKEEGGADSGYEAAQDFFLSWTLRCSKNVLKKDNFLINFYARRILFSLLYGKNITSGLEVDFSNFESFEVLEISTKRQFKRIDLLLEITIKVNSNIQNCVLNIENKWYTNIKGNQLGDYVQSIRQNLDLNGKELVNVVIFCDNEKISRNPNQFELCKKYNYTLTNVDDLKYLAQIEEFGCTGNALFDAYWCK